MLKWPAEGTELSKKIHTFFRAFAILDAFDFIGHKAQPLE